MRISVTERWGARAPSWRASNATLGYRWLLSARWDLGGTGCGGDSLTVGWNRPSRAAWGPSQRMLCRAHCQGPMGTDGTGLHALESERG